MAENSDIKVCQVCGDGLDKGTIVYCASCNTPHHRDCWDYTRQCSTFGCGSSNWQSTPLAEDSSTAVTISSDSGDSSSNPVMEIDESGEGWLAGSKVRLSASPFCKEPGNYQQLHGHGNPGIENYNSPTGYSRLDLETSLENFFTYTAIVFLVLAFCVLNPKHGLPNWALGQKFCLISSILMFIRMFVDCTYVLDNIKGQLLYSRSIFGITSTWKICGFSEIKSLGINAIYKKTKHSHYYEYEIVLKLPDRSCITVSAGSRDFWEVEAKARELARHLETRLLESHEETSSLVPTNNGFPMTPIDADWRSWPVLGNPGFWQVALFMLSLAATMISYSN